MEIFLHILASAVSIYLGLASFAMLLRVLLQFFVAEDNKILLLCFVVSEPFVMPFRFIFAKLNIGQNTPLDIPFFVAYLTINILQILLPVI